MCFAPAKFVRMYIFWPTSIVIVAGLLNASIFLPALLAAAQSCISAFQRPVALGQATPDQEKAVMRVYTMIPRDIEASDTIGNGYACVVACRSSCSPFLARSSCWVFVVPTRLHAPLTSARLPGGHMPLPLLGTVLVCSQGH